MRSVLATCAALLLSTRAHAADNDPFPAGQLTRKECDKLRENYRYWLGRLGIYEDCPPKLKAHCDDMREGIHERIRIIADKMRRGRCDRF